MLTSSIIHFAKLLLQVGKDHVKVVLLLQFHFSKMSKVQYRLSSLFGNNFLNLFIYIYMPINARSFQFYYHKSQAKNEIIK